jgi:multidrug efflux pump subunit AcrA (membrane-fusion protein)
MSDTREKEPRRCSWFWLSLMGLVIVAAAAAAVVLLPRNGSLAEAAEADLLNWAEVVLTDLTQEENFNGKLESVGGTGVLVPAYQVGLSFATPGTVLELPVQVGQEVQAGDLLARVDASALGAQYEIAVAQAQINFDVAQQALDDLLNWEPDEAAIAQLESNVAAAQAVFDAAQGQETAASANIEVSNISVAQAERQLAEVQEAYQQVWDPARDWELYVYGDALTYEREAATAALQYAQENLQIARLNYDAAVSSNGSSASASAQSQLLSAQQALASALAGLTTEELETAETAVAQAQLNLQQAQLNLETHLAGASLFAPVDGTVMSINGHLGGPAGAAPFITLADLSQPTLEIFLDENNLDKMTIGAQVQVVFSALPAQQFSGTVVQVAPQLIATSDDLSTVRALVKLDDAQEQTLPAGLTAAVDLVGLTRIVRVFLPLDDEGLLSVGDPVTVELPDFTQVPGIVVFVPQTPTASASGQAAFHVLVGLGGDIDDPAVAAELAELPDETSVDVIYVSDAVTDVMAIPVSALVALLEGGYAVEMDAGLGEPQLVAVEVGFFGSNNMIAVTSDSLQPGDQVVVP